MLKHYSANRAISRTFRALTLIVIALSLSACANQSRRSAQEREPIAPNETFTEETIFTEAQDFFGRGAQGLAEVLNRVMRDRGSPTGYIKGDEAGGSVGVGLRYGRGTLYLRDGRNMPIYWRGPSIGIDVGGNASKAFILIYDLPYVEALYQRFGGVEGSLYYVGGVGANYNRAGDVVLAPVRFGVGWRQGINVGYLQLSTDRSWFPF